MFGFEPAWQTRRVRLEALRTAEGHALPARLKAEIVRQIERLELSLRQIAEMEAARDAALAAERQAAVADEAPPAEATDAKPGMLPASERAGARLLRLKRIARRPRRRCGWTWGAAPPGPGDKTRQRRGAEWRRTGRARGGYGRARLG